MTWTAEAKLKAIVETAGLAEPELFKFQLNKPIIMSLAVSEVTYGTTGTWA